MFFLKTISSLFLTDFGSRLGPFWSSFSLIFWFWSSLFRKSRLWDPFEKNIAFSCFLLSWGTLRRSNWYQNRVFFSQRFLVSNFHRFWSTFGPLLEPFGTLKDLQIRPKTASDSGGGPRRWKSMILGPFWEHFGTILGAFWYPFG